MRRAVALAFLLVLAGAVGAWGQGEPGLRGRIEAGRAREQRLATATARLARLERAATRDVAVLEDRVAGVQADLAAAEARVRDTGRRLEAARARVVRLQARLAQVRRRLAALLRARYQSGEPTVLSV